MVSARPGPPEWSSPDDHIRDIRAQQTETSTDTLATDYMQDMWAKIDAAVHGEAQLTKVAEKFLMPQPPLDAKAGTVPTDRVVSGSIVANGGQTDNVLTVNEADVTPVVEMWVDFGLTPQQVSPETKPGAAVTLAIRAANLLARAEDVLIFRGSDGFKDDLFQSGTVNVRGVRSNNQGERVPQLAIQGFLSSAPADQVITVPLETAEENPQPNQPRYGENTFAAVADGYARLQRAHYGRCALVLPPIAYADTYAPLKGTLIMPADRLKGLLGEHYYDSAALPESEGVLLALDGDTMDLVVALPPTTEWVQGDTATQIRFRVRQRFALRVKDPRAVVRLKFVPFARQQQPPAPNDQEHPAGPNNEEPPPG